MSSRRHNLPGATTRSRGLSAAGGGSVATIASATVSRIAAHAVITAMTNAEHLIFSPCTARLQERVLRQPRRSSARGKHPSGVMVTGQGQPTALTCCSSLYETQVTQKLILHVPVIS